MSVLLVDDDPHTGAIFEMLMEHHRIPFSIVHDSVEALDYLRGHSPNIIVVDLFLPDLDGFQTLDRICAIVDRSSCRILATTAYYTKDTENQVLGRGFDGYVPKPFVPESFLAYLAGG